MKYLLLAWSLEFLWTVYAGSNYIHTDVIKTGVSVEETYLTPDDFRDLDSFREGDLKQILQPISDTLDLNQDPLTRAGKFEGDIKGHNKTEIHKYINESNYNSRNAVKVKWQLWPGGTIPYSISTQYGDYARKVIAKAMDEYHTKTCLNFKPRDSEKDYIYIHPDEGCYSYVGRIGGKQSLSLDAGCIQKGIVIHELMHSAGFFHEHARADRDDWIDVKYDNIMDGAEDQFESYSLRTIQYLGAEYDYGSIMHFGPYAFSKYPNRASGKTIIPRRSGGENMGQRIGFSETDLYKLNKLYQCEDGEIGGNNPIFGGSGPSGTNGETTEPGSFGGQRPTEVTTPERCEDTKWNCFLRKTFGRCHSYTARTRCRKSCGYCSVSGTGGIGSSSCKDERPDACGSWRDKGYCDRYPTYMQTNCKKSCNLCRGGGSSGGTNPDGENSGSGGSVIESSGEESGSTDPCSDYNSHCPDWVKKDKSYCSKYPKYMKMKCPKSCSFCTPAGSTDMGVTENIISSGDDCTDKNNMCSDYASRGYCIGVNERVMKKHCRKSCNLC